MITKEQCATCSKQNKPKCIICFPKIDTVAKVAIDRYMTETDNCPFRV